MCHRFAPCLLALLALLAAACSGDDDSAEDTAPASTFAPPSDAAPEDFSGRGPYAVGQVDLELDPDHQVAVFYPVDPDAVPPDAQPYSYSGEDILDPTIERAAARIALRRGGPVGHVGRPARQR